MLAEPERRRQFRAIRGGRRACASVSLAFNPGHGLCFRPEALQEIKRFAVYANFDIPSVNSGP